MLRKSAILLTLLLAFSSTTQAQFWKIGKKGGTGFKRSTFNPHTSIGFGAGSSHYYSLTDELTMFNRLVNDQSRFNVGAHLTRHISKNFSIKGNLNYEGSPLQKLAGASVPAKREKGQDAKPEVQKGYTVAENAGPPFDVDENAPY